jgi:hypothetical protein
MSFISHLNLQYRDNAKPLQLSDYKAKISDASNTSEKNDPIAAFGTLSQTLPATASRPINTPLVNPAQVPYGNGQFSIKTNNFCFDNGEIRLAPCAITAGTTAPTMKKK